MRVRVPKGYGWHVITLQKNFRFAQFDRSVGSASIGGRIARWRRSA